MFISSPEPYIGTLRLQTAEETSLFGKDMFVYRRSGVCGRTSFPERATHVTRARNTFGFELFFSSSRKWTVIVYDRWARETAQVGYADQNRFIVFNARVGFDRETHVVDWPPLGIEFTRSPEERGTLWPSGKISPVETVYLAIVSFRASVITI